MDIQGIAAAIRSIPTSLGEDEIAILLPTAIHALAISGGDGRKPHTFSDDVARSRLKRVNEAAIELSNALQDLPPQAAAAFRDVAGLKSQIGIIGIIADHASRAENISHYSNFKSEPFISPAVNLAFVCASVYIMFAGKRPTVITNDGKAYGPYLDLVKAVFKARNLNASPESSAREAKKLFPRMEKSSPNLA